MATVKNQKSKKSKPKETTVNLTDLVALRDAVLEDYKNCQKACDNDSEFTTSLGNGVNSFEAIAVLEPLYKLAKKCL